MLIPIPVRLLLGALFVWYAKNNWDQAVFILFLGYFFTRVAGWASGDDRRMF